MEKKTNFVSVSGHNIEYELLGTEQPVVVLLNGLQMPMSSWEKLAPHLRSIGAILQYNRLGVGLSDLPSGPQDGYTIASQLNSIFSQLALDAPVVLVGHSMGGLYANLYARLYPEQVRGVVLLEATHPDEPAFQEANIGFVGKALQKLPSFKKYSPADDPNSEYNSVKATVDQIADSSSFPNLPLLVISGGKNMPLAPEIAFKYHQEKQTELVNLSPQSTHIKAENSSHFPQLSEPELVAEAIATFIQTLEP